MRSVEKMDGRDGEGYLVGEGIIVKTVVVVSLEGEEDGHGGPGGGPRDL